jgi:predicted DNA-binding protein (MmcQ/YjbR family)
MAKDINQAVREVCLSFPESEEYVSHGFPNFRVRSKTFASYLVNHHGDGRVALWLNAPSGAQHHYVSSEPKHFFVPPYVGPRGWLGVHLNKGLSWNRVAALARQAYEKVAPRSLADSIGETIQIKPPASKLAPSEVDPLQSRRALSILKPLRKLCLSFPETSEALQFGSPVWRAGKKVFALMHATRDAAAGNGSGKAGRGPRFQVYFWVGVANQSLMTSDERYEIPAYMGHNGWIALDVTEDCNWDEVRGLAVESYRHFALQRMLKTLDQDAKGV